MDSHIDLLEILNIIDPSSLNYQDWINVGMALKEEGYTVIDWENWSRRDSSRYHNGECLKKWNTFKSKGIKVTGGTIVKMAMDRGWQPVRHGGHELGWDGIIKRDDLNVIDTNWIECKEIKEPIVWNPVKELITYLETLFDSTENVGYVTRSWKREGKYLPTKGCWDRTAGQLIDELEKCDGDIGKVLGDYNEEAGAWIRFNPIDGKNCTNDNVTDFRYALVESDSTELDKQNAIIRELELPVACLVHSGGKSIHAIVRVDASDYKEYRKRVDYLYNVCNKNGIEVDQQNRNPSRLSRMPGVTRKGKKQFIIDTNIGKKNWEDWFEWIEGINDDLPEPESLKNVWDNLPDLATPLIDGVLRKGHKMLIAGPSKAGKSFALIELCIAIAEGREWLLWPCSKGKVLYVNLELDRASCLHRFKDVYNAMGIPPNTINNIDIWNLRGKTLPMDKLAPKLIRRAAKKNYIAVIIDPIYKVITGDENSADQMANFCNQFDKVCTELECSVIYCHHHSKGAQGGKRIMDRASGSGVFSRDPDAIIDLIELNLSDDIIKNKLNRNICECCMRYMDELKKDWRTKVSQDDMLSSYQMKEVSKRILTKIEYELLEKRIAINDNKTKLLSGWRIEGTLREFPKFEPKNLWFDYPIHIVDDSGILSDVDPYDITPSWKKNFSKKNTIEAKNNRKDSLETAYSACEIDGEVKLKTLSEYLGVTEKTVRNRIHEHGGFLINEGKVRKKNIGK